MNRVKVEVSVDLEDLENEPLFKEVLARLNAIKSGKADFIKRFGSDKANAAKSYISYINFRDSFKKIDTEN